MAAVRDHVEHIAEGSRREKAPLVTQVAAVLVAGPDHTEETVSQTVAFFVGQLAPDLVLVAASYGEWCICSEGMHRLSRLSLGCDDTRRTDDSVRSRDDLHQRVVVKTPYPIIAGCHRKCAAPPFDRNRGGLDNAERCRTIQSEESPLDPAGQPGVDRSF